MKKLIITAAAVFVISSFLFSNSDYKMVKDLSVKAGESYPNSILSWGGALEISGNVKGSVILIGGSLKLDGRVEEDIICVSTAIAVGDNALIKGDFFVISGKIKSHEGAPGTEKGLKSMVEGEYLNFNFKKIENTLIPILSDTRTIAFLRVVIIFFWFIIALIVFAVVPRKINSAEEIFEKHMLKLGAVGILSLVTFIFSFFIFIILCFVIIGIPLLFLLVLLYFVSFIFGRTVMFYFIGIKLSQRLNIKNVTPAVFIMIGAIIYAALKFLPVVGPVLLILMNIFEIGIGVSFFFRKKFKLDSAAGLRGVGK